MTNKELLHERQWLESVRRSCSHACDLRAPDRHTRPVFQAHPGATTFPPVEHFDRGLTPPDGSTRFPRALFSVPTITGAYARAKLLNRALPGPHGGLTLLGVRLAGDPGFLVPVDTAWNCTLCSVLLSSIRVGDHMSIVFNRVQREIVCFSSVPNRTLPDTESRSGSQGTLLGVSHSTLHGSEGGSPSCFVDSDAV